MTTISETGFGIQDSGISILDPSDSVMIGRLRFQSRQGIFPRARGADADPPNSRCPRVILFDRNAGNARTQWLN